MVSFFQDQVDVLARLHDEILRALQGLPTEALDWSPAPGMNSIAVLVVHLTGAERYWIGDVIGQDPSGRDRDAEFRTQGLDTAALAERLNRSLDHVQQTLEKLSLADLEALRWSSRDGQEYTVGWCLGHTLEHTALHLGHIQITRQWLELG